MYWCYSCQTSDICSTHCKHCSSQAIEQMTSQSNPSSYKPYIVAQQRVQNDSNFDNQEPIHSLDSLYRSLYSNVFSSLGQRISTAGIRVSSRSANGSLGGVSYVIVLDSSSLQDDEIKGLTEEEINKLNKKIVTKECTVCQQLREENGFLLKCGHQFHEECLIPWIKQNGSCPTCRCKLTQQ